MDRLLPLIRGLRDICCGLVCLGQFGLVLRISYTWYTVVYLILQLRFLRGRGERGEGQKRWLFRSLQQSINAPQPHRPLDAMASVWPLHRRVEQRPPAEAGHTLGCRKRHLHWQALTGLQRSYGGGHGEEQDERGLLASRDEDG